MTPIRTDRTTQRTCACGQDLEGCSRQYCPRCGCELPTD